MLNGICDDARIPYAVAQGHYILQTQTLSGHIPKQNTLFSYLLEVRHIFEVLLERNVLHFSMKNFVFLLVCLFYFLNPELASFVNFQPAVVILLFISWRRFCVSESCDRLYQESYWQGRPLHQRKGFIYMQICNTLSWFHNFSWVATENNPLYH